MQLSLITPDEETPEMRAKQEEVETAIVFNQLFEPHPVETQKDSLIQLRSLEVISDAVANALFGLNPALVEA